MKKVLSIALVVTMMLMLAMPAAAVVNVTVNKATVAIDGVCDEAYAGPTDIAARFQNAAETNSMSSATGKVWTAWDDASLYFYLEIYDKTPNQKNEANNDNVEIFIDWNNVGAAGTGGSISGRNANDDGWDYEPGSAEGYPFWQVRIPAGPNLDGFQDVGGAVWTDLGWGAVDWGATDAAEATTFVTLPIDGDYKNGYIIEVKIGIPAGVTLTEGKVIPFDIQICDNMQGIETRDGQVFLEASEYNDMQWAVPSTCNGRLTLGAAYAAPAVVDDTPAAPADDVPADAAPPAPADDAPADAAPPATSAPKVGDGAMMMFIVLAITMAGAVVVAKRAKNRA